MTTTPIPIVDMRAIGSLIAARLATLESDAGNGVAVRHRHERPAEDAAGSHEFPDPPVDRAQVRLIAVDSAPARTAKENDVRRIVISLAVSVPESLTSIDGGRLDTLITAIVTAFERQKDSDAHHTLFYELVSVADQDNPELPGHAQALVIIEASAHRSTLPPPPE